MREWLFRGESYAERVGDDPRGIPSQVAKGSRRPEAKEAKRQRRLERQRREAAARHKDALRRRLRNVAVVAILVVAVGAGAFVLFRPDAEVDGVIKPPDRGGGHVAAATYDTATPTSGEHSASAPRCGVASEGLALDLAVHALEHGTVVVWHRADIDDELRTEALDVLREWDSHWILSPNPGIDEPFVATAWNRLKTFDQPDESLREFVDTYRKRGPERVDCPA